MVRDAENSPAMSGPGAVGRAAERAADSRGVELALLESFVHEHYPRLVRLAGLITRDADQAQDAVQSALERAWRKRAAIRDSDRLRPWLDRIVAREAIRQTRGRQLSRFLRRNPEDWVELAAPLPDSAEVAGLREALGRLSPEHRAVIALHLHAGYSVEETARILEVPFDTVRSRLRAAREHLRRDMAEVKS